MVRAFVDEPGLDRDLLKDGTALKRVVANVKKTLGIVYPKLEVDSRDRVRTKSTSPTKCPAGCRRTDPPIGWI